MQSDYVGKAVELFGMAAIIVSLIFVGLELRASNVQARAAAFQAIGIATAEFHHEFDDRMNLLFDQAVDSELIKLWSYPDWLAIDRIIRSDLRLFETVLLQVEQGLLDETALGQLGFSWSEGYLSIPVIACLWSRLSQGPARVGPLVIARIESGTPQNQRVACSVDIGSLREDFLMNAVKAHRE